jgi:tRNA (mo5U34)-methyltransferase
MLQLLKLFQWGTNKERIFYVSNGKVFCQVCFFGMLLFIYFYLWFFIQKESTDLGILNSIRDHFYAHKGGIMNEELKNEMNSIKWWHRIELEDGLFTPGEVVHGADGSDYATTRFGMPKDLSGKTVLDVGTWDGFFSFEAEKRGASKVVACDVSINAGGNWGGTTGFNFAKKVLKSNVEFKECSVEDLISNNIGTYDIVMCYGVLYHLQNLIPALKNLAAVTKEYALIETAVLPAIMDNPKFPLCAFLNKFENDPTNYWYPNTNCLIAMLQLCGFKRIEVVDKCGDVRVTVKAFK